MTSYPNTPFGDEARLGRSGHAYAAARNEGRAALVGYLPVGYPDVPGSIEAMTALCEGSDGVGVDIVEVGMPYSDPVMDGLVIQHATTKALANGVRTRDVLTAVEAVAKAGKQATAMIYWNLVETYGVDVFARDFAAAGGAGLITPDLTPDEADAWLAASDEHGLDRIFLVAPSSTHERLRSTLEACRGWVYATSVMGVTGTRTSTSSAAPALVARVREAQPALPVGVGLGVSNGAQAKELAQVSDGVIVGSALVKHLMANEESGSRDLSALRHLVDDLARGVRGEA